MFHDVLDKENFVCQKFKRSSTCTLEKIVPMPSIISDCSKLSVQHTVYSKIWPVIKINYSSKAIKN